MLAGSQIFAVFITRQCIERPNCPHYPPFITTDDHIRLHWN